MNKKGRRLNERGEEVLDPKPANIGVDFRRPPTLNEMLRQMRGNDFYDREEDLDFEEDDILDDMLSPHEERYINLLEELKAETSEKKRAAKQKEFDEQLAAAVKKELQARIDQNKAMTDNVKKESGGSANKE